MMLLLALLLAAPAPKHDWLGTELPLPLAVRTPQDLAFKGAAERQYLIFNLLASGKQSWDEGNFAAAAQKWESLLSVPSQSCFGAGAARSKASRIIMVSPCVDER